MRKYTESHEWIEYGNGIARVGITAIAEARIGAVILVELPCVGHRLRAGTKVAFIESAEGVFDLVSPVSGVVTTVNNELENNPEWINQSPESRGWVYEFQPDDGSDIENLPTPDEYKGT